MPERADHLRHDRSSNAESVSLVRVRAVQFGWAYRRYRDQADALLDWEVGRRPGDSGKQRCYPVPPADLRGTDLRHCFPGLAIVPGSTRDRLPGEILVAGPDFYQVTMRGVKAGIDETKFAVD